MIGAQRFFGRRMFAPRYFPKLGAATVTGTGGGALLLLGAG